MSNLIVCGVDPGTFETAIVLWDGERVIDKQILKNEDVIPYLKSHHFDIVVCEHIQGRGMPVGKEVFITCYWIGRFWQICLDKPGCRWAAVYRSRIQQFFCQSSKAGDSNIRRALLDRFGLPGTKKAPNPITYKIVKDMWSAFAIAVYGYDTKDELPQPIF